MEKRRKNNLGFVALLLLLLVATIIPSGQLNAASKKKAAKRAYDKLLSKSEIKWRYSTVDSSDLKFALKDINRDGTPELLIYNENASHSEGWERVYTCYKGKLKYLGTYTSLTIYPKKKCYQDTYSNQGTWKQRYFTIRKGKRKKLASYECSYTRPSGVKYTKKKDDGVTYYYYNMKVNGKKASYKKCMKTIKKLSKSPSTIDYLENTEYNRSLYLE